MTRAQRIALGVATAWPFVWIAIFFGSVLSLVFSNINDPHPHKGLVMPWAVGLLIAGHFFTILLLLALIAIYLVILYRTDYVPNDMKTIWTVILVLSGVLGCAVFWFLYIRPRRDDVTA